MNFCSDLVMPYFAYSCISHPRFQVGDFRGVKFREGEAFPAKVFERSTDEIQLLIINGNKTVVEVLAETNGQRWVLRIELRDIGKVDFMPRIPLSVEMF